MYKEKVKTNKTRFQKLLDLSELPPLAKKLKSQKKKIVFTIGSFNLLQPGQCRYLAEAKSNGDILVVGVTSDISERIKGAEFPLISEDIRKELLAFLKVVDYIISVDERNPYDVLLLLQPDIFYTVEQSWDSGARTKSDKQICKMTGTKITVSPTYYPYYTTNDLVEHIANIRVIKILENYLKDRVDGFSLNPDKDLKPADFGLQTPTNKQAYDPKHQILDMQSLATLKKKHNRAKICLVGGSFDLLHIGHARFIEQAALNGDILVVGIPSDAVIRYTKGVGRPIISEYSRAYTLCHLDPVDYVAIFDGGTVFNCIEVLQPDVFYTVDEDWNKAYKSSKEYKYVKKYGGEVVVGPRQAPLTSSSGIIDKLAQRKVKEIFRECMDEEKYQKILNELPKLRK